jgi:multiple sugar transport system permease protein
MQKVQSWAQDPKTKEDLRQFKLRAKNQGGKWSMAIFRFMFIVSLSYVILYPIIILLSRTFRPVEDMNNPNIVWIPINYTLDNFRIVMERMNFWPSLWSTLTTVTVSTVLTVIACGLTGYGLARYRLKLNKLYIVLVALTIIVPLSVIVSPLMQILQNLTFLGIGDTFGYLYAGHPAGLRVYNTPWVFYLPAMLGVGIRGGLFILVFYQFFRGMPKELENAARIDGCGELGTLVRVMAPNAGAPALVTTILGFVWYWSDYHYGLYMFTDQVMLSNKVAIIRDTIRSFTVGERATNEGGSVYAFSACLLFIIPPLILYIIAQRFFMQSVERTGITG